MKVVLISDIHGNAHALKAIIKAISKIEFEMVICCGDYVGYYYEPDLVLSMLDKLNWTGVGGNHESMLNDWVNHRNRSNILSKYGSGIFFAEKKLSKLQINRLIQMPATRMLTLDNKKILICHGSPNDRDYYLYPDSTKKVVKEIFNYKPEFDIMVCGHTHYPAIWHSGNRMIINPGSVGQTRDRIPGACWALLDTQACKVEFFRERYNFDSLIKMCKKNDLSLKYLAEVLVRT